MSRDIRHAEAARLLVIEDDEGLIVPIRRGLEEEGYFVDVARTGEAGLQRARSEDYDLLIVDWRLPGRIDGRTLVETLRSDELRVPILMLTALRSVDHRVAGLDAGADDYVMKPFSFEELLARLRAMLRRERSAEEPASEGERASHLHAGPLDVDTARQRATLAGRPLELRPKELRLLTLLLRNEGTVMTRTVIAERVWGSAFDVTDNAIDVTVSGLRSKLISAAEKAGVGARDWIETVRGTGYRLASDEEP